MSELLNFGVNFELLLNLGGFTPNTSRPCRRLKKDWPKAKKALAVGQSPPQELEVSPCSGLYLLVIILLLYL